MTLIPKHRWRAALAVALAAGGTTAAVVTMGDASADTGASCSAKYTVSWQTPSNSPPDFGVSVTVTNNSTYPIKGWSVTIDYSAGQKLKAGSAFSANVAQSGSTVTATPTGSFNANLAAGASTSWGFHATYDGKNNPLPTVTCTGPTQGSSSKKLSGPLEPLGVNTASWDTNFVDASIATDLSAARTGLIRYPGGSWADEYDWQKNTAKGDKMPVDFAAYSKQVDAIANGQKFVTVNYGSDTPASAGAWAKQARNTPGQQVALWEIGNEMYGSWENDTHTGAHTASSYATNSVPYMKAIKDADPNAQICYDYAMDGELAPGSGAENWKAWNETVLKAGASYIDCADVHWYPINGISETQSTQSIMALIDNIPAAAAQVKATLAANDPTAYFVVGEANMSQTANEWNEKPVGALFAAANTMEWLSFGAESVEWWDVHNYGKPDADFGMFSSGTDGQPAVNTPFPPYYGYKMASKLAVKGATVGTLAVATPNIYGYQSKLPDGSYAVMLVNADPANGYSISTSSLGLTGGAKTRYLYDKADPTIATSAFSGSSVTVPAESIVVLTSESGAPPSSVAPSSATSSSAAPSSVAPSSVAPSSAAPSSVAPSSVAPSSPAPSSSAAKGCTATYTAANSWSTGFLGSVAVKAAGGAINGWKVTVNLPSGASITNAWNGVATGTGPTVQVTNTAYNGQLAAGGSTSFGFQATGPSTPVSVSCTAT